MSGQMRVATTAHDILNIETPSDINYTKKHGTPKKQTQGTKSKKRFDSYGDCKSYPVGF
eukprot:CAMPEP_0174334514 /NCGR_PEP_ID=MMETSP0810-20121108/19988_1 /TAXON_ID=73025 ORGANISM="Eutreptiella gymnastica-like, Strain CCMP1594" /NCGR_SAMPLE_ID=MMETSP0810 /ASSEMBLY_ACC=CAM_ASM_000659 /LENGTH=58 /DNA_ID=CAMNT_0015452227 /DNA_START=198 /DNA_END=374 /DNA_ORIENTATION=-